MSKHKKINQKREIIYNLINAGLAGLLVLLGAFTTGNIDKESLCAAAFAALVVGVSQFKKYWDGEAKEYTCTTKLFSFIRL